MTYIKDSLYNTNLPTLLIERSERYKKYPQIGYGGEGSVHKYDNKIAFKTFDFIEDKERLPLKFKKIELLGQLQDESFCFPMGLIGYEDEKKEGYYTDLVTPLEYYKDFEWLKFLRDTKKLLEFIIKADNAIQRIHKKGIILGDIRGENIMIDTNGNPRFVDTDNYAYSGYHYDVADPRTRWLSKNFDKEFSYFDNDRYLFAMMAIQYFANGTVICLHQTKRYFNVLIDLMNVDPEVKDGLRLIFSDAEDKPYIGSVLREIDPEQEILTREAIQRLNRI